MKPFLGIAVLAMAAVGAAALSQTTDKANRDPFQPAAEHHAHLLSPASAKLVNDPPQPAVELPEDLARLLRDREKGWNDKAALTALYTEDSLVLTRDPSWIRGRDEVIDHMSTLYARPYRITPVASGTEGSTGYVAGYFTRGEADAARHFGHFLWTVKKGADGAWRIAAESPTFPGHQVREPVSAEQLVANLDEAGIRRAAVLSTAYWHGSPLMRKAEGDEYANVRAENDWTVQQVARFPDRLVALCSFNPLKDYALAEIDRCAKIPQVKGFKLHVGNSRVDMLNAEHVEKLRRVFAAINERRLAIVIHLWTQPYGREHAEAFLSKVLPAAPDIPVQIAHFAGGGPGYTDEALEVFANAIAAKDPRTKNLYFDVATVADGQTAETLRKFAERIRQVGPQRVLFGTDMGPPPARLSWLTFRTTVPLTEEEIKTIAGNVAPYLR
ncbi:MAG TPA: amidohydrolase family protein [Thermoanaerobaculia bacterium]